MNLYSETKNNWKHLLLKINNFFYASSYLFLLLSVAIIKNNSLNSFFGIYSTNENWKFYSLKFFFLIALTILFIMSLLILIITLNNKWIFEIENYLIISFLLAIITFNFCFNIFLLSKYFKKQKNKNFYESQWKLFKLNLGIKKWKTQDYILISNFAAISIVLAYIEENFVPHLPFGGGLGLKYMPLIIISFATCFISGWLTGFITSIISLIFIPSSNIINSWSFILDYFLPLTTPALIAFLPKNKNLVKNIFTYINYFIHCFLVLLIIYLWQVISGYLIWTKLFPTNIWKGYKPFLYSLIYNFIHIFIFTYPLLQILIPPIYRSINRFYVNR